MIKRVEKVWGHEEWLENGDYCVKWLTVNPRSASSLHYHPIKKETFVVVGGECELEVAGKLISLDAEQSATIEAGTPHRFSNLNYNTPCLILEASTHHDDADVVRLEESRKL